MAECLVLAIDTGQSDRMAWNRGMVVDIKPDGHTWGTLETLPRFWRLIVTGATVAECWAYMDAMFDVNGEQLGIRGRALDYDSLSTPQKRALDRDGYLTVTKTQADNYIKSLA